MNLKKLITESASKEAMGIAAFTATRGDAVQKFIDDNGIDASALYKYVKNGKMPERMAFVSALVGNPGNKMFKMLVSKFGMSESINQNQINLLKATYGDIKKINPNSPAVKKLMMVLKKLPKDDLEMISKAKINFVSTMAQSILRDSNVSESTDIDNLQKRKTDLLKQVDPLIAKKKKLYSDVDITTPKSSDEKKLDKEIADLFSEINDLVHKIAKLKKSQNEGTHNM